MFRFTPGFSLSWDRDAFYVTNKVLSTKPCFWRLFLISMSFTNLLHSLTVQSTFDFLCCLKTPIPVYALLVEGILTQCPWLSQTRPFRWQPRHMHFIICQPIIQTYPGTSPCRTRNIAPLKRANLSKFFAHIAETAHSRQLQDVWRAHTTNGKNVAFAEGSRLWFTVSCAIYAIRER